jgi:chromosome segregation ATPase
MMSRNCNKCKPRISSLRATESKKIQAPRQELKKLIGEYEEKIRVLNLRLQAGDALQGDSNDITSQVEAALEDAHEKNRNLKEKIKGLQSVLNDVFRTGAPLKDDRNPAKSSSRESSSSMASVKSEVSRRNKRDLSPPSKQANEDFEFKKPRPRNQVSGCEQAKRRREHALPTAFLCQGHV